MIFNHTLNKDIAPEHKISKPSQQKQNAHTRLSMGIDFLLVGERRWRARFTPIT
jgi:hypothetical protein